MSRSRILSVVVALVATIAMGGMLVNSSAVAKDKKTSQKVVAKKKNKGVKKGALKRTRKTVKMLDDVYKTVVVLVTEHYVKDEDSLSAGSAAKALFAAIKKKGWHEVKLLDASGQPYNDENIAKDDFEKKAIKTLKSGKAYYDEVVTKDGKHYLRAATIIPVVMEKCIMCHPNYKDAKKGEAIGALSYTIPIE